jgi:hypothetical protein
LVGEKHNGHVCQVVQEQNVIASTRRDDFLFAFESAQINHSRRDFNVRFCPFKTTKLIKRINVIVFGHCDFLFVVFQCKTKQFWFFTCLRRRLVEA